MIDILFFSVLSCCWFDNLFRVLVKFKFSPKNANFIVSTIHAVLIVLFHTYLMIFSRPEKSLFVIPNQLTDHLGTYNLAYSLCLGYAIADSIRLFDLSGTNLMMLFHHLLMGMAAILSFYVTNFTYTFHPWYISLGHLSEISTPLLNYIQYRHGKVALWLKYSFAFIYLLCRPVNLTYLSYIGYQKYGLYSILTTTCIMLTLLNYFWCYRIYLKSMDLEEEYKQGMKLLEQQKIVQPEKSMDRMEAEKLDQLLNVAMEEYEKLID